MPRGITDLGSRGHQAASHGPLAAWWRSHGGGHDCGPPVCVQLQLGAGHLLVRLCARCMLPLQHSACSIPPVLIPLGLSRLRAGWCRSASPAMWSQWPGALHTPRWKHSRRHYAGQGRHASVVAACLPPAGCRPPSLQCAVADGGPGPWKRVDVQWETRSTRCAVTSGNGTLRTLIRVACAGSPDSSESMPLGVAAKSSPSVVDGERPSRSSWCEFKSPAIGAAGPRRRMVHSKGAA
ncbi:hypothetical protein MOQ_006670 [Trypanosoma cruzi marinkellei]|uniref:Uncharacterized protein n=1 Tax=Trypanosoma cruzi marinkellei TaxID=85056 RepID=K2MR48_TRYCR|nr:hypothetical protein MOQ_006670 [Trypanosoma cruzi marinkellei]